MPKIQFLSDALVEWHNPDGSDQLFEAGKVYEVDDASAHRWIRRGAAEIVTKGKKPAKEADSAGSEPGQDAD